MVVWYKLFFWSTYTGSGPLLQLLEVREFLLHMPDWFANWGVFREIEPCNWPLSSTSIHHQLSAQFQVRPWEDIKKCLSVSTICGTGGGGGVEVEDQQPGSLIMLKLMWSRWRNELHTRFIMSTLEWFGRQQLTQEIQLANCLKVCSL